ncbi:MAG TPA: hypothetical protein PK850_12685 [Ignavibacteria bacterium]|nr:hypothetical protein [Ignavibacteria bacterium]
MNKKFLGAAALVVIFAFGFLYLNQSYLIANDKDGKDCSKECTTSAGDKSGCDKTAAIESSGDKTGCDKSKCDDKNKIKAGGEFSSYQFVTDKVTCDDSKADLQKNILTIAGVKEVNFGSTCNVSKMTNVTIMYAAGETTEENIAASLKEKNMDCSGKSGCDKDGKNSGDSSKECPSKNKKSSDSKQL